MSIVICDIDGTLALRGDRPPYKFEWAGNDSLNNHVAELLDKYKSDGLSVVFVTGREEKYRTITQDWLNKHRFAGCMLLMRRDGDPRSDDIVKKEIFDQNLKQFHVYLVLDDRNRVVEMWRDVLGLVCWQVADGNF